MGKSKSPNVSHFQNTPMRLASTIIKNSSFIPRWSTPGFTNMLFIEIGQLLVIIETKSMSGGMSCSTGPLLSQSYAQCTRLKHGNWLHRKVSAPSEAIENNCRLVEMCVNLTN